jgi:polyphosphate kinase
MNNMVKKSLQVLPDLTAPTEWTSDDLDSPELYINRELSLLEFNRRVLELARDETIPLLERVKFLCISCTNLDEFFEVRVAAVGQRQKLSATQSSSDNMTPAETLAVIREQVLGLVADQYELFNSTLLPALKDEGISFSRQKDWSNKQRKWLHQHFSRELMPVLSPLGLDPVHPFPRILNKSLNLAVALEGQDAFGRESDMALVRAPRSLPRIIRIPPAYARDDYEFVLLSDVLSAFMQELFPGMKVSGAYQFRVTRDSELFVDEEEIEDLARALEGELQERGFAEAVRLEVTTECPEKVESFLAAKFGIEESEIYRGNGPVNLNRLMAIHDLVDKPHLKYQNFQPRLPAALSEGASLFESIRRHDYVLHHPYDSFMPVVELLRQASRDPQVLAIKQTLYRTGIDSVLVQLLINAARNGKDVTVVVELRARFDEADNIALANRMQEAGVQVVYGVVGYKTHAKLMLIVRRETSRIRRYVHMGTGNYHQGTARGYTDWCVLTCHQGIAEDVHRIFQQLSGLGKVLKLKHLLQSPFSLHSALLEKIQREATNAEAGKPARIDIKVNGLTEPELIAALYRASRCGVQIRLIVRGICCLRPGIKGLSENIEVVSVLGRFLEHSRIYYFHNDGKPDLYCSSADWMERNLFHRVETAFPIVREINARRIINDSLNLTFQEHTASWRLQPDGSYQKLNVDDDAEVDSQNILMDRHH